MPFLRPPELSRNPQTTIMTSIRKGEEPHAVADKILKRAEAGKMARKLQNRLALAQFKTRRGWQDLALDTVETKFEEELRHRRPNSSGNSSSSTASELPNSHPRALVSSPLSSENFAMPAIFSDEIIPSRNSSASYQKRLYHSSFPHAVDSSRSRKKMRSSPISGRNLKPSQNAWDTKSSPIKPKQQQHFTTTAGPNLSFFRGSSSHRQRIDDQEVPNFLIPSDDEDTSLPVHSFDIHSSPPHTPPPARGRGSYTRRNKDNRSGKSGEEGADLLLYLATSPSPANPVSTRTRLHPPSTPPPKNTALPSSMMTTPGGGGILSAYGAPNTPSQAFDFSDFVNITPSPAQSAWPKTPRTGKTPLTIARKRLTFENSHPSNQSPHHRDRNKYGGNLGIYQNEDGS